MKLHKEGYVTAVVAFVVLAGITYLLIWLLPAFIWLQLLLGVAAFLFYLRIVYFFRVPKRSFLPIEDAILAPADGEVVAIEEVFEEEYLQRKCIQVSVFMSPSDVHINWIPASGDISYYKYHPGKHMVAWHPKSSTLNERTSVGMKIKEHEILIRQVAGAMARRIVCYAKEGKSMQQTQELGFIKFGSRVDVFLPLETTIQVSLHDKVVGGRSTLALFN